MFPNNLGKSFASEIEFFVDKTRFGNNVYFLVYPPPENRVKNYVSGLFILERNG